MKYAIKRLFDILLSVFGLVIFFPIWLLISIAIFIGDGRPVFYCDRRVGLRQKIYSHFKFRSMAKNAEEDTGPVWSKRGDARISRIGRIIRATAMDELPQLLNIIKGDMSFVGPRPERPFFVEKFLKDVPGYEERFSIRPGLTGMAQVYGTHDTSPEQKLKLDLAYIKMNNLWLDIKLIALSILITLRAGWDRFGSR